LPARAFDQPATGLSPPVNAVPVQAPQQSALLRMPLVTLLLPSLVELQTPEAPWQDDLGAVLNADSMSALRDNIRAGRRPECATADFLLPGKAYV
jgi:hypothetical protein